MMDRHQKLLRYLVAVLNIQWAIVLQLGVVEETQARFAGFRAELVHDTGDGHELHHIRVADDYFVEQNVPRRVIVAVNEARHDGHLPGVERASSLGISALMSALLPTAVNRPALTAKASLFGVRIAV
jgi:hypothetical protein